MSPLFLFIVVCVFFAGVLSASANDWVGTLLCAFVMIMLVVIGSKVEERKMR